MHIDPLSSFVGVGVFVIFRLLLLWAITQYKNWQLWYYGMPLRKYFWQWVLLLACKALSKTKSGIHMRRFDNRHWISPNVKGFVDNGDAA